MRRNLNHWLVAATAALVLVLVLATAAAAHTTTVVQSSPADGSTVAASPSQVTAQFSEELDTKQSVMQVFNAAGAQVSDGNGKVDLNDPDHKTMIAAIPAALDAGAYTVKWHVYLTDGDDSSGTFGFTVASAAGAQVTATTAPAATAGPTIAPTATVSPTASVVAAAQAAATPTPVTPETLPSTGGGAMSASWPIIAAAALAVLIAGVALIMPHRRAR